MNWFVKDTLLSAATATGAGTTVNLLKPCKSFTSTVTWGGATPTSTLVYLEGSVNGSNWFSLAEVTVTATNTTFHVADKPSLYVRGNYVSKVGGDGTTAVTMTVLAQEV